MKPTYIERKMLEFVNCTSYLRGVIPSDEANKRHLKCLIDVSLLMGSCACEGCRVVFDKLEISFIVY